MVTMIVKVNLTSPPFFFPPLPRVSYSKYCNYQWNAQGIPTQTLYFCMNITGIPHTMSRHNTQLLKPPSDEKKNSP